MYQLNSFIGTLLASFLSEGSVSWLYYADRLVQFPLGVFAIAISTAALPSLSTQAAINDLEQFGSILSHALRMVFFITLPATVGLIILGKPIIRVLFERGAFDATSTLMTDHALIFYALGLLAFSGIRLLVAAFYALQDTKTPVKIAVVAFFANLIFSLLLMGPLKHGGLALALSLASSIQFCLLAFFLKRKVKTVNLRPVLISGLKCAFAAAIMGAGSFHVHSRWLTADSGSGLLSMSMELTGLIGIGVVLYFMFTRILGCRELGSLWDTFSAIIRRVKRG